MPTRHAYFYTRDATSYLYHVTLYYNLDRISEVGITPHTSDVQRGRYVYLTEVAGLPMWIDYVGSSHFVSRDMERRRRKPEGRKDTNLVVLRTPLLTDLKLDQLGTADAGNNIQYLSEDYFGSKMPPYNPPSDAWKKNRSFNVEMWEEKRINLLKRLEQQAKAYISSRTVRPSNLEVWTGSSWVPVKQWQQVKVPYNEQKFFDSLAEPEVTDPYTLRKVRKTAMPFHFAASTLHLTSKEALARLRKHNKANHSALYATDPFIPFEKVTVFSCIPYLSRTQYKYVSDSCADGRDLVQGLKDGDASAIKAAAKIMARHPKLRNFEGVLVPVPRSTSSKLNTNKLLCEELVRLGVGSIVSSMVHRVHDVESSRMRRRRLGPQHGLSKEQHYESMGIVGVPDNVSVVLVDDVFTAGTTIKAAAARLRMFRHQGEIYGATLAYVTNDTTSCSPQYTTKTARVEFPQRHDLSTTHHTTSRKVHKTAMPFHFAASWDLTPSKDNPGYLTINIHDEAALLRLSKLFPDMAESRWLAEELSKGPVRDTIGMDFYKDSDDHWVGEAWWNDSKRGVNIHIRRGYGSDGVHLHFKITPMQGPFWYWETTKPISGKRTYRNIAARAEAAWALKRFLNET